MGFGFLRAAVASPEVTIGNVRKTAARIIKMAQEAAEDDAKLIVFPELCLAGGYTAADLFHQKALREEVLHWLERIVSESSQIDAVIVVGLPLCVNGNLYNVAAVIDRGRVAGLVPKTYLPTGAEFQEARWFGTADDLTVKTVDLYEAGGQAVPIGTDLLFRSTKDPEVVLGVELCEDVWTPIPPSSFLAAAGATVLVNLSASNELVGKARYRRDLIVQQSGRCIAAYLYASAGVGESTTDVVFGGHCMIAENGTLLGETERFSLHGDLVVRDLDVASCIHDRMRTTSFGKSARVLRDQPPYRTIAVNLPPEIPKKELLRPNPRSPFIPSDPAEIISVCSEVFTIQVNGLVGRLRATGNQRVVLGLSGGLDSTLALLVCVQAFRLLGYDRKDIHTITMPGMGTTSGTKTNAHDLAKQAGVAIEEIPIETGALQVLADIGHNGIDQDITYENAQARYRTLILMQRANQYGGIVIGTGDLSESALGWCTYNGDHMSHYNVNCSVPKTLVRHVVRWVAEHRFTSAMGLTLGSILDTPVSPELVKPTDGKIAQKTEELIGPYDLHDFFLYHMIRKGEPPRKIYYLATLAFKGKFEPGEILKWLKLFYKRFFANQFKRSAVPDGPKVGSVSLSPRGDWRMPSDASGQLWQDDLAEIVP